GLEQAREKMTEAGVDPAAIEVFAHYYRLLETGETGMVPESSIQPIDVPALADIDLPDPPPTDALAETAVVKLNGGLGTSMGLDRAKSLLEVRDGSSFLDVIVQQVLAARKRYGVRLPLLFMNSFRTSADTLAALGRYPDLVPPHEGPDLPVEFWQNMEPKLRADDLTPVSWPADADLEWCPPGHGDLYTALRGQGLLDRLLAAGFRRVFVSNSDNLGAVPDPKVAQWFADSGAPIAIEAVRRTASDKKGGHFARRTSDGRVVLRETAQTPEEDREALGDLDVHRFTSTNNLWFDVQAMREQMDRLDGVLGLAMIKNLKHVDPADPSSPQVIQIETAMGAAIEVFDGAALVEVTRERFVPVKTTNDLLLIRSDAYRLDESWLLGLADGVEQAPYVDLDSRHYKLVDDFEARFPDGVPSLREASSLVVDGDWTFGADVLVVGSASLHDPGTASRVDAGSTLG
ncbi:MAG: UTP--glucose-1-phosphate uridylyltransferase, partial [Nocardioidaceae bacterium]